ATTTTDAPLTASAASVVAATPPGMSTSGRYQGLRRRTRIPSTTSGSRAQRRTAPAFFARWIASAVPQLPPPTMEITGAGSARPAYSVGGLPKARPGSVRLLPSRRHTTVRFSPSLRSVPARRRAMFSRWRAMLSAETRRDAVAPAEPEEDRPAVADDGRQRARRRGPGLAVGQASADPHGRIALGDVAEQREEGREPPGRPQDVRRADGAAAVVADVADAEDPGHEEADRQRTDHVGGDDRDGAAHDQRSSPGTIAR